jgi:hypothetical protein
VCSSDLVHLASISINTGTLFSSVKQPRREADLKPSSSVQDENRWNYEYISIPPHAFVVYKKTTLPLKLSDIVFKLRSTKHGVLKGD